MSGKQVDKTGDAWRITGFFSDIKRNPLIRITPFFDDRSRIASATFKQEGGACEAVSPGSRFIKHAGNPRSGHLIPA